MTSENEAALFGAFFTAVLAIIVIAVLWNVTNEQWKEDAVKRGYAEWIVKTNGTTTFKWKE